MAATYIFLLGGIVLLLVPIVRCCLRKNDSDENTRSAFYSLGALCLLAAVLLGFLACVGIFLSNMSTAADGISEQGVVYVRAVVPINGSPEAILIINPSPQTLTTIEARGTWTQISRLEALKLFIETGLRTD